MLSVIGFDLDMTLVDSAAGIGAAAAAALAEQGLRVAPEDARPWLGLPLEEVLARLAPGADVAAATVAYRRCYADLAVPLTTALPGAAEALAAVRGLPGGRVVVVSTKREPAVHATLRHVGLAADEVHGGVFGADKAGPLRRAGVDAFVGDHPGDMVAARAAGVPAVGVSTGPHPASGLLAAGADVVLPGLVDLPEWLERRRRTRPTHSPGPG